MPAIEGILARVVATCERLGLEYYVTGSVASMFYSVPRLTTDVDIVVELPSWKVADFCADFPAPDYYVSTEAAKDAVMHGGQFNIIQPAAGVKADIMAVRNTPYDECRLSRARRVTICPGVEGKIAAPEDVILKKLEFFREGGSDKHLGDITKMLQTSGDVIDMAYIEHWVLMLGVQDQWNLIKARMSAHQRAE